MGTHSKLLCALLAAAAVAIAQLQTGRVFTDFSGRTIVFESGAALAGESQRPGERILASTGGELSVVARAASTPPGSGVIGPMTNDHGHLRAYSLWQPSGPRFTPSFVGVVRHDEDGWEVRRSGQVTICRDGRWAVFSDSSRIRTVWLDLWLDEEFVVEGRAIRVLRVADDGALVYPGQNALILQRPHAAPVEIPLPFQPFEAMIDRTGGWAAVSRGGPGLYRVSLTTGQIEPWMAPCQSCFLSDIAANGSALLYQEWNSVVVVHEPGAGIQWLNGVDRASFTGDDRAVMARTTEGIVRLNLDSGETERIISGPVELSNPPPGLSPGLWLRSKGRGLSHAAISLNGLPIEPLELRDDGLVWVVPPDTLAGTGNLRLGQPGSPFEPLSLETPIHAALPVFITLEDTEPGSGTSATFDFPFIRHADSSSLVIGLDPARPGETLLVMMTGLNGHAAAIQWTVSLNDAQYYPLFESAESASENPHWTLVRLRMPAVLPSGLSVLTADLDGVRNAVLLSTRNE